MALCGNERSKHLQGVEFVASRMPVRVRAEMDTSYPCQNVKCYVYHFKHCVINRLSG